MGDFRKLIVWKKAHAMAIDVERAAARIRRRDHLAVKTQIMRAAMSVPANIVERCGEQSDAQYSRFLRIVLNSSPENFD